MRVPCGIHTCISIKDHLHSLRRTLTLGAPVGTHYVADFEAAGKTLIGGPTEVYIRGALAYRDGEVLAEPGSGRFIERAFRRAAPAAAVR